jgi:hypothetical protein
MCEQHYKCFEEDGSCFNGGVCNMITGQCDCSIDPALGGPACEKSASCEHFGCRNGGVCDPLNGVCACLAPFYGGLCDLVDTSLYNKPYHCSTNDD